jgi:hypothetical protein
MDRRTFLQRSSLILPGLSAAGLLGTAPSKLIAANALPASISLAVVTDQPDKTLALVQELLKQVELPEKNIRYTEYVLSGNHVADIAYTRSGRLIDFRKDNQPLSAQLRTIAARLDLPHHCENPLLTHFSINEGLQQPSGIRIFKDNQLIIEKSFPVKTETIDLDGTKGRVVLELGKDRSIRFVETSCAHKTCMSMGPINQAGQNLVCIPNRIAVTINGTNISAVDSITF